MNTESRYAHGHALTGQHVAIVGASSGVGLALARLAAAEGARLTLFGRDIAKLESVSRTLPNADLRRVDLLQPASIESASHGIAHLDHLIITAGTFALAPFTETGVEQWRDIMEERVIGGTHLWQQLRTN